LKLLLGHYLQCWMATCKNRV